MDLQNMDYTDPKKTRIHKDTKFIIDQNSEQVYAIFKNRVRDAVITAAKEKYKTVRENKYGDLLITKK